MDFYDPKTSEPELREFVVKFVGGAAAVTKVYGVGVTVTYIGTGLVDLTFADPLPGPYVGITGFCFEATTAADVKGHTIVGGPLSTRTVRISITDASEALHDLAALEWLTLKVAFKASGVT